VQSITKGAVVQLTECSDLVVQSMRQECC